MVGLFALPTLVLMLLMASTPTIHVKPSAPFSSFSPNDTAMVLLSDIDPSIILDVKYATKDNFTGQVLYPASKVYFRRIVAQKLAEVQRFLQQSGHSLKVFDGYRPLSIQKKMWEIVPDERYVADPRKGSRHNRGAAVDLTIVRLADGTELDMGTPYDDFTEKSHTQYAALPEEALSNRRLLSTTMQQFDFLPFKTEWWHFDYKEWNQFAILDIPIE